MLKKSRTLTIAISMFVLSSAFVATPKTAHALFFNLFEDTTIAMLETLTGGMDNVTALITTLSTDIGTMADRILLMSDDIGEMADRIVATEVLMADLVVAVNNSNGPSTLLTTPTEGDVVSLSSALTITLSNGSETYDLFISNAADMSSATNILVQEGDTTAATSRVVAYATGDQLYFAVKAVSGDTMGPISNTVMVNLIP